MRNLTNRTRDPGVLARFNDPSVTQAEYVGVLPGERAVYALDCPSKQIWYVMAQVKRNDQTRYELIPHLSKMWDNVDLFPLWAEHECIKTAREYVQEARDRHHVITH